MKYSKQKAGYYECQVFKGNNCRGQFKPKVVLFNNDDKLNFLVLKYDTMNRAKTITSDILKGKQNK
jgi:hypothetical protein